MADDRRKTPPTDTEKKASPSSSGPLLRKLVEAITPDNRHDEVDWGVPRGREVW